MLSGAITCVQSARNLLVSTSTFAQPAVLARFQPGDQQTIEDFEDRILNSDEASREKLINPATGLPLTDAEIQESVRRAILRNPGTVNDFVDLVAKVEQAYPDLSQDEVLAALRRLGGYDDANFQKLFGTEAGIDLMAQGGLTDEDILRLTYMLRHGHEDGFETGLVTDQFGNRLAMGHVLTGLTAGDNYDPDKHLDVPLSGWVGSSVDNIYTATIAGDLGQSATLLDEEGNATDQTPYIGNGTEATYGELYGDIDGAVIGNIIRRDENSDIYQAWENGAPISEIVDMYYDRYAGTRFENASEYLPNHHGDGYLEDQTKRFADNYRLRDASKADGLWDGLSPWNDPPTHDDSERAVEQFETWLEQQLEIERERRNG